MSDGRSRLKPIQQSDRVGSIASGTRATPGKPPSRRDRVTIFIAAAVVIITSGTVIGLNRTSGQGETGAGEGNRQS